jgi:hypothetical protein
MVPELGSSRGIYYNRDGFLETVVGAVAPALFSSLVGDFQQLLASVIFAI